MADNPRKSDRRRFLGMMGAAAGGVGALAGMSALSAVSGSPAGAHDILSVTHNDALPASVIAGDLLYGNATPKWARLPRGTNDYILRMVADLPTWVAAPDSHVRLHALSDVLDHSGTITDAQHGVRTLANAHKFTDLDFTLANLASLATRHHIDLDDVSADQHHPQSHTLTSHSTRAHSELTGVGTNDHHPQLHAATHQIGGGDEFTIGHAAADVWGPITKPNIGVNYVDIWYVTGTYFNEYNALIDTTGATQFRLVFTWVCAGSGTQQCRWLRVSDLIVLWESPPFTTDRLGTDSGWVAIPAGLLNASFYVKMQGKSTVAVDDPVAQGYKIMLR